MKTTRKCVKCSKDDLYHSACLMDRGEGNEALCLTLGRSGPIAARELGQFEVYVCKACGYSELYVANPSELDGFE